MITNNIIFRQNFYWVSLEDPPANGYQKSTKAKVKGFDFRDHVSFP